MSAVRRVTCMEHAHRITIAGTPAFGVGNEKDLITIVGMPALVGDDEHADSRQANSISELGRFTTVWTT